MMRLDTALVCLAMLYGADALWFDGSYFAAVVHVMSDLYMHW
jgi:hypothetical protein